MSYFKFSFSTLNLHQDKCILSYNTLILLYKRDSLGTSTDQTILMVKYYVWGSYPISHSFILLLVKKIGSLSIRALSPLACSQVQTCTAQYGNFSSSHSGFFEDIVEYHFSSYPKKKKMCNENSMRREDSRNIAETVPLLMKSGRLRYEDWVGCFGKVR